MVLHHSPPTSSSITRVPPGGGRITVALHGTKAIFEELSSAYPLKLLSPQVQENGVATVYLLSYGGGLVGGDRVELSVQLKEASKLVVFSQGSTKIFKTRPGSRLASIRNPSSQQPFASGAGPDSLTTQTIHYTLAPKTCLFLLPDPVTCFRSASYNQVQTFHIAKDASLIVLDWLTSGRKALDEEWAFTRYYSENEVFVDGKRVVKDVMLLQADDEEVKNDVHFGPLPKRTLGEKLAPYSCYAMVLFCGPEVNHIVKLLAERINVITVFNKKKGMVDDLLWSFSPIDTGPGSGMGAVVRVAGKETEIVKQWLQEALKGVEDVVGTDVYRRAFA